MPHHGQAPSPPLGGISSEWFGFQWTSRLAMESRKRITLPPVAWQPNRQVSHPLPILQPGLDAARGVSHPANMCANLHIVGALLKACVPIPQNPPPSTVGVTLILDAPL
jgi:hypothetical protein